MFTMHIKIQEYDEELQLFDWCNHVQVGAHLKMHQSELLRTIPQLHKMWDSQNCTISSTKHRIELEPNAKKICQMKYRAGPYKKKIKRDEVERMVNEDFIKSDNSDWQTPVVSGD